MSKRIVFLLFISSIIFAQERLNLSFEEAIDIALKNNPQILTNEYQKEIYEYKGKEAFSGFLPQLNLLAVYKRTTVNSPAQVGLKIPSSLSTMTSSLTGKRESMDSYNNYSLGLSLNQLIYDFNRTSAQYNAALFLKDAANQDIKSSSDNLVINLYQTVLNYTLYKELYEAALNTEKQMESHLKMAKAQVMAGVRTNIDILRAESDLYNARLNTLRIKNQIVISKLNLKNLLGIFDETDIEIRPPERKGDFSIPEGENNKFIQNRPEYLSLKLKIDSLRASLKSARSGYFPSLSLIGGFTYNGYELDGLVYNWNIGGQLSWNIFSGFYTTSYDEELRAQIRMYEANLSQLVQSLYLEIENSKISYKEALERVELNRALLKTAEETLNLTEARYMSGLGTFIEVSDAQNIYTNAKNSLIQAEYDLYLSRIRLEKALGLLKYNKRGD